MRGRYPLGPEVAGHLAGSRQARERLRVILELIAGKLRVGEACEQLGIGGTRLDQLRRRMLRAALDALEPRPGGANSGGVALAALAGTNGNTSSIQQGGFVCATRG
jgi:hypothetical protein